MSPYPAVMKKSTAIILLLTSCLLWSCIGISSRSLYDAGFTPLQVSAVKSFFTAAALGLILVFTDISKLKIRKGDAILILLVGGSKFAADTLIFYGQSTITLSLTTMLQTTYPYYVALFSIPLFGERLTKKKLVCMAMAAFGCVLATGVLSDSVPTNVLGIFAAVAAGAVIGLNVIAQKISLNKGYSPETVLFYMFVVGAVISLFTADPVFIAESAANDLSLLGYMLLLGLVFTLLGHFLNLKAMKYMSASNLSLICLSEVVFTALVGLVAFNEVMGPAAIAGMILIIASIAIMNLGSTEDSAPAPK